MVPGASASVSDVSATIWKEMWVDCLTSQEPCDDACSLRVLKVPSWKGVGSVPDNQEAREGGGLFHRDWYLVDTHLALWAMVGQPLAKDAQTIVWMPNY